jgi:hypothetical protein
MNGAKYAPHTCTKFRWQEIRDGGHIREKYSYYESMKWIQLAHN